MEWEIPVATIANIEEELNLLDRLLRRLKIEYEIFFNNPAKRPPTEIEWKVTTLLRKFSDGVRLNFSQRYRYNEMAQRYAIQSDLWRKKMRIREEGYRRPQEALLSVQGVRSTEREGPRQAYGVTRHAKAEGEVFSVQCSEPAGEREKIESLYNAFNAAKEKLGESASGNFDSFVAFVSKKTNEIRHQQHCDTVVYSVETQDGHVKLKAKAK
jgi:hypothetical protein